MSRIPDTLVVHPGVFHCDDILVAAMLTELNPDIEIKRMAGPALESVKNDANTLVADVGEGKFDHHQADAALREDGHKHASCGLVYEEFSDMLFPRNKETAKAFTDWIEAIEDSDNGVVPKEGKWCALSRVVSASNPNWDEDKPLGEAFSETVALVRENFVEPLLSSPAYPGTTHEKSVDDVFNWMEDLAQVLDDKRLASIDRGRYLIIDALEDAEDGVMVLDRFCPWQETVCDWNVSHEYDVVEHVVFPSNRDSVNVQAVPVEFGSFDLMYPLPEEWLENKPEGCSFVHQARFLAAFDTKENALAAAYSLHTPRQDKKDITDVEVASEVLVDASKTDDKGIEGI